VKELTSSVREVAVLQEAIEMMLSSMDADTVLHHMLLVARNYFGVTTCAVLLLDTEKNELYVHTQNGLDDEAALSRRYRIGHDGLSGHVAKTRSPLYAPEVSKDPRYVSGSLNIKSELALPLTVRDELLGVLTLSSNEVDHFGDDMIGLLAVFAGQASVALENARLYSTERRRMRQIEFVNLIARSATTAQSVEQLTNTLAELITDTFEGSEVSLLLHESPGTLKLQAHAGGDTPDRQTFQGSMRHGIIADAMAARMNVLENHCSRKQTDSPGWNKCLQPSESELAVPLMALGETLGVIVISHSKPNAFGSEDRSIAQAAGDVCATAIRNVQLTDELLRVANTDTLTRAYNQRYFHVAVGHEITRSKRFGKPFSVVMFDLRHFSEINQRFGFDGGDDVLRSVAQLLRASVRGIDTVCRYTADRFAIVLPETDAEHAIAFSDKIARGLAALDPVPSGVQVETIFAAVQYPIDGASELELVRHLLSRLADHKRDAKRAGAGS
jgi:diguanylate cyclase (GGDEF)-like protein